MSINVTRQAFYTQLRQSTPHASFRHEPAGNVPTAVSMPDGLDSYEVLEIAGWRKGTIVYDDLSTDAKAKADEFIAYDKALNAWQIADMLARESQWHWARVDAAIMNYATVPRSGSSAGTGSGAPATPVSKQEP